MAREEHRHNGEDHGHSRSEGTIRNSSIIKENEPYTTTPRCYPGLVVVCQPRLWPCSEPGRQQMQPLGERRQGWTTRSRGS